jgi:hypothetical protein
MSLLRVEGRGRRCLGLVCEARHAKWEERGGELTAASREVECYLIVSSWRKFFCNISSFCIHNRVNILQLRSLTI